MASDNGEMEIQEDVLDGAIKMHSRILPPDGLADRCLATIPSATSAAVPQVQSRRVFFPWVKLAVAASVLIGAAVFLAPHIQQARDAARRTTTRNNLKPLSLARNEVYDTNESIAGTPPIDRLADTLRGKDVRDGTELQFSMGKTAGGETLPGTPAEGDKVHLLPYLEKSTDFAKLQQDFTRPRDEGGRGPASESKASSPKRGLGSGAEGRNPEKAESSGKPNATQSGKVSVAQGGKPTNPFRMGGHSATSSTAHAEDGSKKEKQHAEEQQVKALTESITTEAKKHTKERVTYERQIIDQQKSYAELQENYKQARADAAKYAEQAKLSGDQARIRTEEAILLRNQLDEARKRKDEAQKVQFETQQKYIELKASKEMLEATVATVETREKEVERIKEILRRHEKDALAVGLDPNAESYAAVTDNPFLPVSKCPLSTFSTDVDTASYANVRRFLSQGQMPPRDAVRIEELINYFSYDYAQPKAADPFSVNLEVAGCPWNGEHRLVRIGLKGREIADQQRPPANLVFLVDVSGSMQPANKLPLLKTAMKMLVGRLGENERVAIVTYSHEIRLVLPSTTCDSKETIIQALEGLQAAGSTNGGGGIQMAYSVAVENFIQGGVNRVILATDGDFNVGITDPGELTRFIEQKRESGVFLSVLGFGMGNLKDATLERLADKGNGHYAYIDTIDEARKVLVDQLSGTLVTIAKDVKLQIEFNPRTVSAYRLIGYENRVMPAQDFNDDRKDAGDIGAGHTVTALYEIVPAGKSAGLSGIDPLKYQPEEKPAEERRLAPDEALQGDFRRELLTVKLRYKKPNEHQSMLAEVALTDSGRRYGEASSDFKFASAVAAFGMILRGSPHRGSATLDGVLELGEDGRGADREGYRSEFLKLVRQAKSLRGQ